jgi:type IV secretion system protein VirB10
MDDSQERSTSLRNGNAGPNIERSEKEPRTYGKRIILVFLLVVAAVIAMITFQAKFKVGISLDDGPDKSYRTPPSSGFAELAASMRRDRQPVQAVPPKAPEKQSPDARIQRIVIEGRPEAGDVSALPRYYSDNADAQLAQTLRTMKVQAITARPVVENFKTEDLERSKGAEGETGQTNPTRFSVTPAVADPASFASLSALAGQGQSPDPNGQAQKQNFLRGSDGGGSFTPQGYSANIPVPQQFPYELKAGTLIPGILISGINSDLPGNVIAQVSENVWDTATGKHVLIPKGTRVIGAYDSRVSFGQRRVLLVWNRLVFPDGTTLNIAGSSGVDQAGYSGLSGRVDEHWGTMFKAALFASVFVAGAEIVYDRDSSGNSDNKNPRDAAAESLAGSILDMGTKVMNRAADIQPTITVRPGKKMGIFVRQDVVFPFPYEL